MSVKPKVIIEERHSGLPIITEIQNSEYLRVDCLISQGQIGLLIRSGWLVKRKVSTESASRRRARSGRRIRPLTDTELAEGLMDGKNENGKKGGRE